MTKVTSGWPCDPRQVARARRWLRDIVIGDRTNGLTPRTRELAEDSELILSELLTNAIEAGCSTVSVRVDTGAGSVRIGVVDDAEGTPRARTAAPNELSGRGLAIVAAIADDWGVRRTGPGKEVWATLAWA